MKKLLAILIVGAAMVACSNTENSTTNVSASAPDASSAPTMAPAQAASAPDASAPVDASAPTASAAH